MKALAIEFIPNSSRTIRYGVYKEHECSFEIPNTASKTIYGTKQHVKTPTIMANVFIAFTSFAR
jgi:hypothetical protein